MSLQEYFNYNINFNTSNSLILGQATVASIFTPGSGMLTHTVNTIGNMFMTGGNIGIGTTAPSSLLHLSSSSNTRLNLDAPLANNSGFSIRSGGVEKSVIWRPSNTDDLAIWINGISSNALYILSTNGNVGINTNAPAFKLDVSGTGRFTNIIITGGNLNATFNSNTIGNIITTGGNVGIGTVAPSFNLDVSGTGRFTNNLLATFNSNTIGSIITTGGNAGISTVPGAPLDIRGTSNWGIVRISPTTIGGESSLTFFPNNFDPQSGSTNSNWLIGTNLFGGGTNNFNIYRAGIATVLTINSSGNTGIGTANPIARFHLDTTPTAASYGIWNGSANLSANQQLLQFIGKDNALRNGFWNWYSHAGDNNTSNNLRWDVNGLNGIFSLSAAGRVGILTTNPAYALDVTGSLRSTGDIFIGDGTNAEALNLWDVPGAAWQLSTGSYNLNIRNGTGGSTMVDRVTITSIGNIGIGTTSPGTILDIVSSTPIITIRESTNASGKIYFGDSSHGVGRNASIGSLTDGNDVTLWTNGVGGSVGFATQLTERMRITAGGNVGIGTVSPQATLHVGTGQLQLGASNTAGVHMLASNSGLAVWRGTWGAGIAAFCSDSRGNFGIGTHTPTELLHISNGNLAISSDASKGFIINQASVWGGLEVEGNPGTGAQILNMGVNINRSKTWNSSYVGGWFRVDTRGGSIPLFQWYKKDATGGGETMMACLHSTGNFGIGTVTPAFTLDVNGTIARSGVKLPRYDNGSFSGSASFSIPILFNDTQYNYAEFRVRYVTSNVCNMNISATSYVNAAMNFGECALTTVKWNAQNVPVYATFSGVTSGIFADTVETAGIDNNLIFRIARASGTSTAGLRNHYSYDNVYCWSGTGTARGYGQGHIDCASVGGSPLQFVTFTCSTGTVSGTYSSVHYY